MNLNKKETGNSLVQFIWASDSHFSYYNEKRILQVEKLVQIANLTEADFLTITGDVTDGIDKNFKLQTREEDFSAITKIFKKLKMRFFL